MLTVKELLNVVIIDDTLNNYFEKDKEVVEGLTQDILRKGRITNPVVINRRPNGDLVLLDGHTRLSIAKEHIDELGDSNIDVETESFPTVLEEELFILRNQCNRRNISNTNSFKLKIGEIASKISSLSVMNNQYATWKNPTFEESEPSYVPRIKSSNESDDRQLAVTNCINLSTLSKDTNIPKRTLERRVQVYNNLSKLGDAYSPKGLNTTSDKEFFNVLYERKQLSNQLINELSLLINNPLYDDKIKSLLSKAVISPSLDIKREWDKYKYSLNNKREVTKQVTAHNKHPYSQYSQSPTIKEKDELDIKEYSLSFFSEVKNNKKDVLDLKNNVDKLKENIHKFKDTPFYDNMFSFIQQYYSYLSSL